MITQSSTNEVLQEISGQGQLVIKDNTKFCLCRLQKALFYFN